MNFNLTPSKYLEKGKFIDCESGKIFTFEKVSNSGASFSQGQEDISILFLHGFPTSSYDFLPLMEFLEISYPDTNFRFIGFDFLGLSFSDKPADSRYPISMQTDIMELVIREYDLGYFYIISHDYGVTVAQEFLARHKEYKSRNDVPLSGNSDPSRFNDPSQIIDPSRYPENFYDSIQLQKVIFLNGGLFPETHRARLVQKIMASSFAPLVMPFFKRKQFGKSFSAVFGENTQPSPEELDALWEIIQYDNGHKMIHRLLSYIQQRRENRERWVDSIVNPPVPIRLINGNADPVSGIHMVQRYVELTGREDTVNLTKIGHYPQLEDVEAVGKAVMDFFI